MVTRIVLKHVPNCPKKTDKTGSLSGPKKNEPDDSAPKREWKALASWKYIKPNDVSVIHKDDEGHEWKFCAKYMCKSTSNKGFFQLSHFDSDHKDDHWKTKKAGTNLTKVKDNPSRDILLGTSFYCRNEKSVTCRKCTEFQFVDSFLTARVLARRHPEN
jgi:hypothetical protein